MVLLSLCFLCCKKVVNHSDTPSLLFEKGELTWVVDDGFDTALKPNYKVTLRFIDGDGDLGLKDSDSTPPYHREGEYYNNMIVRLFVKKEGKHTEIKDTKLSYSGRIPFVEKRHQQPSLSGTISYNIRLYALLGDTVMFKFQIIDRALHKSNWVDTDELVVRNTLQKTP